MSENMKNGMEILVHQFDELLCCFRKKLEKLVLVLSNEQCLSCKTMIQTNNEPYVIFRYSIPSQHLDVSMLCQ